MPNVRIRIGAVVDADFTKILFEPLAQAAKKGRRAVQTELAGTTADARREGRSQADDHKRNTREVLAVVRAANREKAAEERRDLRDRAGQQRAIMRQLADEQRRIDRQLASEKAKAERDQVRQERSSERSTGASLNRAVGGAMGFAHGAISRGVGFAGDLARGAGVNLDVQSMVRDFVTRERMAVDLSNSSYQAGAKGPAGVRQNSGQLMQEASAIAQYAALDPTKVLDGLQKFVSKSGDLQGARDSLKELAVLSQATGTDISNMVDAAGDAFANLGDSFKTGEDKARAVVDVMKAMSGQGKLGAVEIKDMATQLAGLAAIAGSFEGDRVQNMVLLGAIAQESRQRGGAKSAAQAVGSVQSLMGVFGKKARLKELDAKGVDVFADKGKTQVRDVQSIIVSAISKSRGSIPALSKMFMDVQAQRAVRGFASVYSEEYRAAKAVKGTTDAQANAKAVAATNAEFDRLKGSAMKEAEIRDSFAAKMETNEAKAQRFQNQIQDITDKMASKLLPELERVGPEVAKFATKLSDAAVWAGKNPGQAVGAVVGASVVKAGVDAAVGAAVQGGVGKIAASGLGSALGVAALTITAAAVTLYAMSELKEEDKKKKKSAEESTEESLANARRIMGQFDVERGREQAAQLAIEQEMSRPEAQRDQKKIAAEKAKMQAAQAKQEELQQQAADSFRQLGGDLDNEEKIRAIKDDPSRNVTVGSWATSIAKSFGIKTSEDSYDRRDVANAEATAAKLDDVKGAVDGLTRIISGGLTINSMPSPGPGAPGVNEQGRTGI